MAQKRSTTKKKPVRKRAVSKKNQRSGLGKFSLGLLLIVALGYGAIAIWEGKIDTSFLDDKSTPAESESITPEKEKPANEPTLKANLDSYDLYFTKAFDFAWPAYSTDQAVIERPYYTLRYNEEHEQAMWVAYSVFADSLKLNKFERKDDFRKDPRVRTQSASLADYRGSGYDRGHLAPAADFSYSEFALSQSFFMSNMSPQNPSFNRGVWKKLEDKVRAWTMDFDHLYVVSGPVLKSGLKSIGVNKVSIPDQYYKIVLDIDKPDIKAIAFLMNNEKSSAPLASFVVSIDQIEKLTGLDFFPSISDELEEILESSIITENWF